MPKTVTYVLNLSNYAYHLAAEYGRWNGEDLKRVFKEKPEYVFHLAAHFANQNSVDRPETDLMVNGVGILKTLEHAQLLGDTIKRLWLKLKFGGLYARGIKRAFVWIWRVSFLHKEGGIIPFGSAIITVLLLTLGAISGMTGLILHAVINGNRRR